MLTPNQRLDLELLAKIKSGQDWKAKEELVVKYLPMVRSIVKHKCNSCFELEDLIQEGLIGLLKAIENYDGQQYAVKFSTFAYICILRKMLNIQKYYSSLKYQFTSQTLSLYGSSAGDESRNLLEVVANQMAQDPQEIILQKFSFHRLRRVLKAYLSTVEYSVFFLYLQGLTCGEIGKLMELDSKVVDNAKTRARLKLQKIVQQYGSLSNPRIPLKTRKRRDLAMKVKAI